MKNIKTIIATFTLMTCGLLPQLSFAQAPEKMSYQAVIRNATNNLISNQPIGMQISVLQGSASGTPVYVETQLPTTNTNGLVSIEIGTGTIVSGVFSTIDWANGPYFIKTETDPTGGVNYTIVGTSQLLSVPYALYAKESGSSIPGPQGTAGTNGTDGLSAYEVAVSNGFVGTEAQWLASLVGAAGTNGTNGAPGLNGADGTNGADGLSAYEVAVSNGFVGTEAQWLTSLVGAQGPAGTNGTNGAPGAPGLNGSNGTNGTNGVDGLSAYEVAVSNGFVGTEAQWLTSLVGAQGPAGTNGTNGGPGAPGLNGSNGTNGVDGLSAYEVAVSNGFVGTEAQWLTSLVGAQGPAGTNGTNGAPGAPGLNGSNGTNGTNGVDGLSAYQVAVSNGFVGTEAQWLTSLVGAQGPAGTNGTNGAPGAPGLNGSNGTNGVDGLSAYEVAVSNGFVGTEAQWLTSLVGAQGPAGTNGTNGAPGLNGSNGTNGVDGLSAYEVAVSNGFVGTEAQWLTSLVGAQGPAGTNGTNGTNGAPGAPGLNGSNGTNGADGLSAYEVAVSNGFVGTEAQWLTSLVGAQGPAGTNGTNGTNGAQGPQGPAGENGPFYLGKDTLGGIVFCLYRGSDGNQHGLVVSKTETTAFWQSIVSTTNGTRSWDGIFNSALMINSPAMTFVNGLGAGWYLPSIDELSILWQNRFFVNKAMSTGGFTLITSTLSYWSSTEASAGNAAYFYFVGGQVFTLGKNNNNLVRGVKAF